MGTKPRRVCSCFCESDGIRSRNCSLLVALFAPWGSEVFASLIPGRTLQIHALSDQSEGVEKEERSGGKKGLVEGDTFTSTPVSGICKLSVAVMVLCLYKEERVLDTLCGC